LAEWLPPKEREASSSNRSLLPIPAELPLLEPGRMKSKRFEFWGSLFMAFQMVTEKLCYVVKLSRVFFMVFFVHSGENAEKGNQNSEAAGDDRDKNWLAHVLIM
jgi:hypothetical protein